MQTDEKGNVLEVREVSRCYGERRVLDGVSFEVKRGERIGLMGPSGSGKTTLLNCLGGIDRPDSGDIFLAGLRLGALGDDDLARLRRQRLGTIFQFFYLLPTLTAAENVELPLLLQGIDKAERGQIVARLMEETGISHRADALPEQMSGGEQQRVAIARALAGRPTLLLADEPTGNLDRTTGETVLNLLETLCEQHATALIMVTHDASTTRICHKVLHLLDGRIDHVEQR